MAHYIVGNFVNVVHTFGFFLQFGHYVNFLPLSLCLSLSNQLLTRVSQGVWWASALVSYGLETNVALWYKIPDEILDLVRKETIRCGVLVELGLIDETEITGWPPQDESREEFTELRLAQKIAEERSAKQAEQRMSPEERYAASQERMRRERQRIKDEGGILNLIISVRTVR
jgi:hypothetical protein